MNVNFCVPILNRFYIQSKYIWYIVNILLFYELINWYRSLWIPDLYFFFVHCSHSFYATNLIRWSILTPFLLLMYMYSHSCLLQNDRFQSIRSQRRLLYYRMKGTIYLPVYKYVSEKCPMCVCSVCICNMLFSLQQFNMREREKKAQNINSIQSSITIIKIIMNANSYIFIEMVTWKKIIHLCCRTRKSYKLINEF